MSLSGLLSLVSTLAIVAAGVFAGMQVRQLNKQRARDSALQLADSFQTKVQKTSGRGTYYEWFQWPYERFEERESAKPAVPAFVAHRGWKR